METGRIQPFLRSLLSLSGIFSPDLIAHLLWPLFCPVCGRPAVPACPGCLDQLVTSTNSNCVVCGGIFPCSDHPGLPPHFFASPHRGIARDLVLDMKYRHRRVIGKLLGEALGRNFSLAGVDGIVPIPLHTGSPRAFNQALEMARGLGRVLGAQVQDILAWSEVLPPQAKGSATERRLMPLDAIRCCKTGLRGKGLILVDDVRTTGTTLLRAYSALEANGATVRAFVTWTSA